jgi:hypothetical protein
MSHCIGTILEPVAANTFVHTGFVGEVLAVHNSSMFVLGGVNVIRDTVVPGGIDGLLGGSHVSFRAIKFPLLGFATVGQ